MNGIQLSQDHRAARRRQISFYHSVPQCSWYSFNQPWKDEMLNWCWNHQAVLNLGPWIRLIMSKYARICVNMPKSASVAFVLHVPIVITCLLECMVTYFIEVYSLKEHEAVFLKRKYWISSTEAGSIWFVFRFRLNTFTSKISNLLLHFGAEGAKGHGSWYTIIWQQKYKYNQGDIYFKCIISHFFAG